MPDLSHLPIRALSTANAVALRLDGPHDSEITLVNGASGGDISADVIAQISGDEDFARKQLGALHRDDSAVEVGSFMSKSLFDWIAASWREDPPNHDGAILRCDYDFTVKFERAFRGALIAETAFPALDADSKQAGHVTIRFTAASILPDAHPQTPLPISLGKTGGAQKLWQASNFQLQIPDLDHTHVIRIEPFTIRRTIEAITQPDGRIRLKAGPIDFPNLRVTLSMVHFQPWFDWYEDFVLKGNNTAGFEKTGSISLLTPNLSETLTRLELAGLGIFRLTQEAPEKVGSLQRFTADLYCEQITLVPGSHL